MSDKITPSLESITVRGKYRILESNFDEISKKLRESLEPHGWITITLVGEAIELCEIGKTRVDVSEKQLIKNLTKHQLSRRYGIPIFFSLVVLEHLNDDILAEVECRPAMWYRITRLGDNKFTQNNIQEALIECSLFVKQIMSSFKNKEIEPVSVYPIIQRTEIKSRLRNLGLERVVGHLDKAEKHITQNNFEDSLKSSRTAFEKTIDWETKKRGLGKTDNYKNDLERLRSKGFLDKDTTQLLQSYYRCLSSIGVHDKGEIEAGIYEAQMGYRMTLVMIDYLVSKLP